MDEEETHIPFAVKALIAVFALLFIGAIGFGVLWAQDPELAQGLIGALMSGENWNRADAIVLGSQPEEEVEIEPTDISAISAAILSSTQVVTPSETPEPTATDTDTPTQTATYTAEPTNTLTLTPVPPTAVPTITPSDTPTYVSDLGILPTHTPTQIVVSRTKNTYLYLKQSILVALRQIEMSDGWSKESAGVLIPNLYMIREGLEQGDPLIINILITDKSNYDRPANEYTYFSQGQEHIGNTDGVIQIVIREDGIFAFFFGRDLFGPMVSDGQVVGHQELFRMGSPLVDYPRHINGRILTWSDDIESFMYELTGNRGDLSIKVSLGRLEQALNSMFPEGVDIVFTESFHSDSRHDYAAGETVHFTGDGLVGLLRQRKGDLTSYNRGSEILRRVLSSPVNILNLVKAAEPGALLISLLNEDLTDTTYTLSVQNQADDILLYQALGIISRSNPSFADDLLATLANSYSTGSIQIITIPFVDGVYSQRVQGYWNFIAETLRP